MITNYKFDYKPKNNKLQSYKRFSPKLYKL